MNEAIIDRLLARPDHGISPEDQAILRRMAAYFDKASLKLVWDDGVPGRALVLHWSDDAVRYRLSLAEIIAMWARLRAGQRLDWTALPRVERA